MAFCCNVCCVAVMRCFTRALKILLSAQPTADESQLAAEPRLTGLGFPDTELFCPGPGTWVDVAALTCGLAISLTALSAPH